MTKEHITYLLSLPSSAELVLFSCKLLPELLACLLHWKSLLQKTQKTTETDQRLPLKQGLVHSTIK